MTTLYSQFTAEPWTHAWEYDTQSWFGDPDETPEHGVVATILADSPKQAEERVLTYIPANFDDDAPLRAEAETEPVEPGRYRVKVFWRGVG